MASTSSPIGHNLTSNSNHIKATKTPHLTLLSHKCNETRAQPDSQHQGCCSKCSSAPKKMCIKCNETPAQNGIHGDHCYRCTLHVPTIEILSDTVDNLGILMGMAAYWLQQNDPADPEWIQKCVLYIGMMGTTGQSEIDQDEKRMIEAGLMDAKCEQIVTYVELIT